MTRKPKMRSSSTPFWPRPFLSQTQPWEWNEIYCRCHSFEIFHSCPPPPFRDCWSFLAHCPGCAGTFFIQPISPQRPQPLAGAWSGLCQTLRGIFLPHSPLLQSPAKDTRPALSGPAPPVHVRCSPRESAATFLRLLAQIFCTCRSFLQFCNPLLFFFSEPVSEKKNRERKAFFFPSFGSVLDCGEPLFFWEGIPRTLTANLCCLEVAEGSFLQVFAASHRSAVLTCLDQASFKTLEVPPVTASNLGSYHPHSHEKKEASSHSIPVV